MKMREIMCKHCRKYWTSSQGTIARFWISHAEKHGLEIPWKDWDPKNQKESMTSYRRFIEENFDDLYKDNITFVRCRNCSYVVPSEIGRNYCNKCGLRLYWMPNLIKGVCIQEGKIGLRPIERGDLKQLKEWRNDWNIRKACREYRLLNDIMQEDWLERVSRDRETVMFAILAKDEELIGCCGLTYIDWLHRRAEISIYIGERMWQAGGHGMMTLRALIRYAFEEVNMHKLEAEIFEFNEASVKLFEGAGFRRSGTFPEHQFSTGKYWDSLLYYLLSDWYFRGELPWHKEEGR